MRIDFVDSYGAPDYGPWKGLVAVVLHTTEGGRGRAGALGTAAFQAGPSNTSGGSYHEIVGVDGDVVTFVRTVRAGHIAGGISTRRDSVWIADTNAELLRYMGARAVADPNAYVWQISVAGRRDYYDANGWPKALVDGIAQRLRQIEQKYGIADIYVTGHKYFQTNRTDPGKLIPLVIDSYNRQYRPGAQLPDTGTTTPTPAGEDMFPIRSKYEAWTFAPGAKIYAEPSLDSEVLYTFGAGGGKGPTLFEEATFGPDGKATSTGKWRGLLMNNTGRRVGWVHRSTMEPLKAGGLGAYDDLVHDVIWLTDLDLPIPSYPLKPEVVESGITQAQLDAAKAAAREAGVAQGVANEKTRVRSVLGL